MFSLIFLEKLAHPRYYIKLLQWPFDCISHQFEVEKWEWRFSALAIVLEQSQIKDGRDQENIKSTRSCDAAKIIEWILIFPDKYELQY